MHGGQQAPQSSHVHQSMAVNPVMSDTMVGCHGSPIAASRLAGAHVDRAQRVCLSCNNGALGDERHLIFECAALAFLRSRYADLFTGSTDTMRSFFAQPDHMRVVHYVIDCLDFIKI